MMKRKQTYTAGANAERDSIKAHIRRLLRGMRSEGGRCALESLFKWILKRDERYNKRAGGLGK